MFKFTLALLGASFAAVDAYTFDQASSVSSVSKMRSLSSALYASTNSASNGAAEEIISSIEDMQALIDDIPGAGFVISHIFPGDSDTKAIMEQLQAIKYELDQMHGEMRQAWEDIMTEAKLLYCADDLLDHEQDIFSAWYNFNDWLEALNDPSVSEAEADALKKYFVTDCDGNKCDQATTFLLNGLKPQGSFPSLACDDLQAMYDSSGIQGYTGYRDYIAAKAGVMLLEAMVGAIMETVHTIETRDPALTDLEALDISQRKYGQWLVDAGQRIVDKVQYAKDHAGDTREHNEQVAKTRIQGGTTDKQSTADQLHSTMKMLYGWNNWAVAVSNYDKNSCYFDHKCDDAVSCSVDTSRNNVFVAIVQVDAGTPAPIANFQGQERWDYWTDYGEMCSTHVCENIQEAGCGGGSIVSRTVRDMKVAYDNADRFKVVNGGDQRLISWAAHDCACNWPHDCNSVGQEFLQ